MVRKAPAKKIEFNNDTYQYLRNKRNILLYTGFDTLLIIQYDPEKNTYYVLHEITHYIKHSIWSDVDDDEYFNTKELGTINRMAKPID